jgi:hypothetical protein
MPPPLKYPLFELTPEQFEQLCIELITSSTEERSAVLSDKPRWLDAVIGKVSKDGVKTMAVEVSHRTSFHPLGLNHFFERLSREERKFDEYVFITSSPLQDIHHKMLDSAAARALGSPIRLLGQDEVFALLDRYPAISAKYFKSLRKRVKLRNASEIISVVGVIFSLLGLGASFYEYRKTPPLKPDSFGTQITSVEESLARLKALEAGLQGLKEELKSKSDEAARVSKEYEDAMKLKALTKEQLEQVKLAVGSQSRAEVFMNYFLGWARSNPKCNT